MPVIQQVQGGALFLRKTQHVLPGDDVILPAVDNFDDIRARVYLPLIVR